MHNAEDLTGITAKWKVRQILDTTDRFRGKDHAAKLTWRHADRIQNHAFFCASGVVGRHGGYGTNLLVGGKPDRQSGTDVVVLRPDVAFRDSCWASTWRRRGAHDPIQYMAEEC